MDTAVIDMVQALRGLTNELPLNDFGLPTGIYRTDLLPFHEYQAPGSLSLMQELDPAKQDLESPEQNLESSEEARDEPQLQVAVIPNDAASEDSSPPEVDAFSLLSGKGDGLPDMMMPEREHPAPKDLSPVQDLVPKEYRIAGFPAKSLHAAFVPLQYDEGFPAFDSGASFWNRLDFEPTDAYMVFERYLHMTFGRMANPDEENDVGAVASGTRSINTLVSQLNPGIDDSKLLAVIAKFKEYYHLYYWGLRAKSYDLFRVTQHHQQQELRAIETQDDHYITSRKLRARLAQYMDDDEDFWDMMTPKVAIDLLKTTTQLERISAGVPATGPQTKETEGGKSFELAFRTYAQEQHGAEAAGGDILDEEGHVLDKALEDPDAVRILQELIIKS
jgi:hypothetical protein